MSGRFETVKPATAKEQSPSDKCVRACQTGILGGGGGV
jgi:hypothetical protein